MGSLEAFRRNRARRSRETAANRGENTAFGPAMGRSTCFIVIVGIESPPCLIGMDIMRPLRVRIDVTNGTTTPAQSDPQTIHLNAAQQQDASPPPPPPAVSRVLLLQTTDIPAETVQLVRCHNPWPSEDVYFCPEDALPAFVTGVPSLSSGSEIWIAIHNHRPEPLSLHSGQNIGILEVVTVADNPSSTPKPGPMHRPVARTWNPGGLFLSPGGWFFFYLSFHKLYI